MSNQTQRFQNARRMATTIELIMYTTDRTFAGVLDPLRRQYGTEFLGWNDAKIIETLKDIYLRTEGPLNKASAQEKAKKRKETRLKARIERTKGKVPPSDALKSGVPTSGGASVESREVPVPDLSQREPTPASADDE